MNETLKVIHNRRSIRAYKAEQITDSELQQILDAALMAPNAVNQQKWHFTVIQDKGLLDRMVNTIKENIMNSDNEFLKQRASAPDYHTFYHAPTVILISADGKAPLIQIDCGLAAQNITLAAESLNIGSCIIASSAFLFASEKGSQFKKELGIPEGYNHICTIALGYKAGENPAAPPRNKDVINYVK
ncbi:nitroreductase family protein [Thermincola potens]|uniref:Nitroreductase n=1 Tax=Thermincola potens (strain JR) TaxID=635013 RepID=D5XC32_THEPJ|nr:nitroreductase [Thermincola potens]ADG83484.1 nitroreductase [Thermincola potens JR]